MATPEGRVKKSVRRILDSHYERVWYFAPVQMGIGVMGIPDIIGVAAGKFFAIETKAGDNQPTRRQQIIIRAIQAAGGRVWVINGESTSVFRNEFRAFAEKI